MTKCTVETEARGPQQRRRAPREARQTQAALPSSQCKNWLVLLNLYIIITITFTIIVTIIINVPKKDFSVQVLDHYDHFERLWTFVIVSDH